MLSQHDMKSFDTLRAAMTAGHCALVEVKRVSDGKVVSAVCTLSQAEEEILITPFAIMVEGNPFALFLPPKPEGGF